jgi:Ca-activated chloride channel family protein
MEFQNFVAMMLVNVLLIATTPAVDQDKQSEDRGKTVRLNVLVTGPDDSPIRNLKPEDFLVAEDGKSQMISLFSEAQKPIRFALVIDHMGAFKERIDLAFLAARSVVAALGPQDEGLVLELRGGPARTAQDWTKDKAALLGSLEKLRTAGGPGPTKLIDSLYNCIDVVEASASQDNAMAIILIADGYDSGSRYKEAQLLEKLRQHNVQIFSICLPSPDLNQYMASRDRGSRFLHLIAKETGGRAFFPKDATDFQLVARRTIADLRNEYTLGYMPSDQAKDSFRKVTVRLTDGPSRDKWTVSARSQISVRASASLIK